MPSSPQSKSATPARPVSTVSPAAERFDFQKLMQAGLIVRAVDSLREHLHRTETERTERLASGDPPSPEDTRAAQAECARFHQLLEPVFVPPKVKRLPAQQ